MVVVGGIATDYAARGERLPGAGESVAAGDFRIGPGGKGANAAVAAVRLGATAALVGCVGADHAGRELLDHLRRSGVDVSRVRVDGGAPTGATVIQVEARGGKQTAWRAGANGRLSVSDVRAAADAIAGCRSLLAFLEVPLACVREAVGLARAAGRPVVLDPAPARPLPDDLLRCVDVIRLDAVEAEILTGVRVNGAGSARRVAERLLGRGAGAVLVEAGRAGNLLLWPGGERLLPLLPVDTVDTTGAGDACSAALAVRLGAGAALEDAAVFANAVAALATTRLGAQGALPDRDAVRALLSGEPSASPGGTGPDVPGVAAEVRSS